MFNQALLSLARCLLAAVLIAGSALPSEPAAAAGFGIKVSGNKLVSTADGSVVRLIGANVSGLEGSAGNSPTVWAAFPATSTSQWRSIASKWRLNVIRLPLNSFDWLNLICVDPGRGDAGRLYRSNGNGTYTPDPRGVYRSSVEQTVASLTAAGLYVILDLHWDGPSNAAGQALCPMGQGAFATVNAVAFWTSVANQFKNYPNVMFELYNEPFGDNVYANWFAIAPTADGPTLLNGGSWANYLEQDNTQGNYMFALQGGAAVTVVGKQALINAIRASGATNVILDSPIGWAGEIETWLQFKPTDPLGQMGVAWHVYGYAKGPAPPLAVLAAGYPIVITENQGFDAALDGRKSPDGYAWAASNDIGCLQWGWNNWDGASNLGSLVSVNPWRAGGAPVPR